MYKPLYPPFPAFRIIAPSLVVVLLVALITPATAQNLLPNGSFDHPEDPLHGWKTTYEIVGEDWYEHNHTFISVDREAGRDSVARLEVAAEIASEEGVKMESAPVPFDRNSRYRLSVDARTTGPNARIYLRGYRWRPRVERHDNPTLEELVPVYNFHAIQFQSDRAERLSNPDRRWRTATQEIPFEGMSTAAQRHFRMIDFLVVQVFAIHGSAGTLYVDNVQIEKVR